MAAQNKTTVFLSGKLYWAKVLGNPVPNYGGDAREWTFEFEPDEKGVEILKKHKLDDRLKTKEDPKNPNKGKFIVLRQKELRFDGTPNNPIRIYDADDNAWDPSKLIGNATAADVKIDIRDYGVGKKKGIYPAAIRITELVSYQSSEFGGMDKGDEGAAAPKRKAAPQPKLLDDDIPF